MEYKGLEVGNTIKSLRIKKNVSVFELAYRAKISQSHVYQLEEGNNKMSIDLLYRLMDALDTDANTILGIKEKNENSVDERLKELNPKMKKTLTELSAETVVTNFFSALPQSIQRQLLKMKSVQFLKNYRKVL